MEGGSRQQLLVRVVLFEYLEAPWYLKVDLLVLVVLLSRGEAREAIDSHRSETSTVDSMQLVFSYLLRSTLIRTLVFLLALARCARVMPEPYQFRNAWPRRFERGNISH